MRVESTTFAPNERPDPHNAGSIWTLILLAPFLAEVLSGATRLRVLFAFIPEVMVWGVGALLAREMVRRWRGGRTSLLLLGLALSVGEEFVIQQTSLAPLPFPGADAAYGRLWGVNWLYFLFMLGYESVFVVLVPVGITELFFPTRRDEPWLGTRGLVAACVIFLLGCRLAWFGWTQKALPTLHAPPYRPPLQTIGLGCATIGLLIAASRLLRNLGHAGTCDRRRPASPWLVGVAAFVMAAPWWELITLNFVRHPHPAVWVPLAAGVLWSVLAFWFTAWLSGPHGFSDIHRWALCMGAFFACTLPGDASTAGWTRNDLIGKYVFQAIGLTGMVRLGRAVRQRADRRSIQA
jgi:hypothetical protein